MNNIFKFIVISMFCCKQLFADVVAVNNNQIKDNNIEKQSIFKESSKININKKNLNDQTEGVLGFVKDQSIEDNKNKDNLVLPKLKKLSPLTLISKIKNYCKAEEYHQKYIMKRNG